MYPGKLGLETAIKRIERLLKNGHSAEALVTSFFSLEKLIKRGTRRLLQQSGLTFEQSSKKVDRPGFDDLCKLWRKADLKNRGPESFVSQKDWNLIIDTRQMRNDLVHGRRVFTLQKCARRSRKLISFLRKIRQEYQLRYGIDPWGRSRKAKRLGDRF